MSDNLFIKDGFIKYRVIVTKKDKQNICFYLDRFKTWSVNNEPLELETVFGGIIRADGCSDVNFGEQDGCLNLYGRNHWVELSEVLLFAFDYCTKQIEAYNE